MDNAVIPRYSKDGDAGMDLTATSSSFDENGNAVFGTGIAMEIPYGYVGLIFPRSSVSKLSFMLANSIGVIDSGFRGEIICKFKPTVEFDFNGGVSATLNNTKYLVGERIAQIIILPYPQITFTEVNELSDSERGLGGFGSTNK